MTIMLVERTTQFHVKWVDIYDARTGKKLGFACEEKSGGATACALLKMWNYLTFDQALAAMCKELGWVVQGSPLDVKVNEAIDGLERLMKDDPV